MDNNISHLIIGKNDNWKQNINIGKKNNQSFTNVPHASFIEMLMLTYKGQKEGIAVTITEESYTSKTSFIDGEEPRKQKVYLGKRIHRGLFSSAKKIKINADLNYLTYKINNKQQQQWFIFFTLSKITITHKISLLNEYSTVVFST